MRTIPLVAVPTQTLTTVLDGQETQIALRQNGGHLYFDLQLGGVPIVTTRICRYGQMLLQDARYRGYQGDFLFVDLQGVQDPEYSGFGTDGRYQLVFMSAAELVASP